MGFVPSVLMMSYPFDTSDGEFEFQRVLQGKRLDALFKLVDANQISILEVMQMEGLSMDEAKDLLENWKWFDNYEKAKEEIR